MQSQAATVKQYLAELPPERREALQAVRKVILENIDDDCEERISYGMIGYAIPHRVYPPGYHCDPSMPLPYAGLASQKSHMSLYLMCNYGSPADLAWFERAWAKTGKKLDMGKSCIRFRKLEDLALDVIGEALRRIPTKAYIARYEATLAGRAKPSSKASAKSSSKPTAGKAKPAAKAKSTAKSKPTAVAKPGASAARAKPAGKAPAAAATRPARKAAAKATHAARTADTAGTARTPGRSSRAARK